MPSDFPNEFFRTERLLFRPFLTEDEDALVAILGVPETVQYVDGGELLSREQAALWIEKSRENVQRFGWGTGAVVEIGTGNVVGWGGYARPEGAPEEIIYGFAIEHWGKGFGPEFVAGLVAYGTDVLNLPELRATVHPDNARSVKILEQQGFVREESRHPDSHLFVRRSPAAEG